MTARRQPQWRGDDHPAQDVQPVGASVECHPGFVEPGLGGQQPDRVRGYVGRVGDQDVDPAPKVGGQRLVKVTLVHLPGGTDVVAGAAYGGGVDVDGVQLDPVQG